MNSRETLLNVIDGNRLSAHKGAWLNKNDPLHRRPLYRIPSSDIADLNLAVNASHKALRVWSQLPLPKRGEILFRIASALQANRTRLAQMMTVEMGKPLLETDAEVQEAIDTANYFAGEGRRAFGQTTHSEMPERHCMTLRMPVGICGIITPWNFPLAVPTWKLFPALICGNAIIWKPSEEAPGTANALADLMENCGIPAGLVNIIHGKGADTGSLLSAHPSVSLISFTGSSQTGRKVAQTCASQLKKYALELGGKNSQIIMEDAQLENATDGALWGAFGTSGQRCTATSRLIVHKRVYKKVMALLKVKTSKLIMGSGLDRKTNMGPMLSESHTKWVLKYIRQSEKKSKLICGGNRYRHPEYIKASFIEPTIFEDVHPDDDLAQREIFAPVLSVLKCDSVDNAIEIANKSNYGLSTSIYTSNLKDAYKAIQNLQAGMTYVNSPTIGAETHMPFGGVKQTGSGFREAGVQALDIFSEWKSAYIDFSGKLQKAQID